VRVIIAKKNAATITILGARMTAVWHQIAADTFFSLQAAMGPRAVSSTMRLANILLETKKMFRDRR
jgi:hypothetical protein